MRSVVREVLEGTLKFPQVRKGYDTPEVDQFLDDIRKYLQSVESEQKALRQEVDSLQFEAERLRKTAQEVDRLREMEQTVVNTLITAQKAADDIKSQAFSAREAAIEEARQQSERHLQEAREQSEALLADARKQAEEMLNAARADVRQLEVVIQTLQRRRADLSREMSELLHRYMTVLDEGKESAAEMEKTRSFQASELGGVIDDETLPTEAAG
ncbi:MAG: DivIVA domain-containing protein [Armatimonadetes bacterium]|nr:DivIVA domain-containing protein [Armatimonadota bacterium]